MPPEPPTTGDLADRWYLFEGYLAVHDHWRNWQTTGDEASIVEAARVACETWAELLEDTGLWDFIDDLPSHIDEGGVDEAEAAMRDVHLFPVWEEELMRGLGIDDGGLVAGLVGDIDLALSQAGEINTDVDLLSETLRPAAEGIQQAICATHQNMVTEPPERQPDIAENPESARKRSRLWRAAKAVYYSVQGLAGVAIIVVDAATLIPTNGASVLSVFAGADHVLKNAESLWDLVEQDR